ncbi:hypothetical protein PF005_g10481 [Phytophthora fragariae]|uniref:Uncharacterized protein n=1 Tax=Phytophthora fragariae TaxID=53985 RepID=A0A6A3U2E6_9STRA|nr:hypothetical protein PF003_g5256 [Phytophthora fragariae]KAE8938923.1 hypothetical protein PF009_g11214 [Phytophthora fragariae]KAE9011698.1 hypothetical protein PF011_g9252 [Phytophthora fragariae]KAE9114212.1 hypothetical protein PF010_g9784 [Phytophthora fragariae]KAE9114234.1 hypothetical protein PF007_g10458 [Phytophthora fragariae]
MNEEDEFGMSKTSRDADPMEQENKSAVKDHSDFNFLDPEQIRKAVTSEDKRAVPLWMTKLPVEKDPSQWTILEVQIRPDRSWEVIKELIATVCIGKGLLVTEEHANSVLFRKKVTQESVAHGMANTTTFLNVFVHVGVSPSKLRVVDICTLVSDENKLLGGMMSTGRSSLWAGQDHNQPHEYALDQLLGALQSTLLSQCLSLSHLYMSTPENSMDSVENAELDEGYVADLKRAFSSEMKVNMRDLCIPLETYAYDQEFACALLIGLLEPSLKKYGIKLTDAPTGGEDAERDPSVAISNVEALSLSENDSALTEEKVPSPHEPEPIDASPSIDKAAPSETGKIYGEVISELVQNLWRVCKEDCDVRLRAKIEEKQQQVTARVEAVQALRVRAIRAIMEVDGAQVSSFNPSAADDRNNVLLYEASCMVNGIPVTLHVTYGNLIYRTMMPVFARTTVIPLEDVVNVAQTTSFGIQVVSVELDSTKHTKGITIAMGLEVDLLFQLLHEIFSMHQREIRESITTLPPLQQQETEKNPIELKKILGSEEEETKEDEGSSAIESASPSDDFPAAANTTSD